METPKNKPSDKPKPGLLGKIFKKVISLPYEYMMHDMAIDHEIKELEKEQHEEAWHEVRHRKAEKLVHSGDQEKIIEGRNIMTQLRLEKKSEFKKSYENAGRKELLDVIEPLIPRDSIRFNKTTGEVIVDKRLSDVERIEYGTILKLLADKAGKLKDHEQQELKERLIGEINRVAQIQNDAIREREVEDMDDTLKKAFLSDQSFFIGHKFAGIKKLDKAAKQEQLLKVYHFNTKMGIENTNVSDMSKDWLDSDFKENIMRGYVTNDQLDKLTQKFDPGQNNLTPQKRKAIYQSFLSRYGIMSFNDSSKIKEERDLYNLIVKFKKEQKDLYDEINRSVNTELAFETDEENKEIEPPNPIGTLSELNHGTPDFAVDKYEEVYKQIATEVNNKRKTIKEDTENAKRTEEEVTEKKKILSDLKSIAENFAIIVDGEFGKGTAQKISYCREKIDSLNAQLVMMEEFTKELGDPEKTKRHKDDFEMQKKEQQEIIDNLHGGDPSKKFIVESFLKKLEDCKVKSK